jgi:hypothetical protein
MLNFQIGKKFRRRNGTISTVVGINEYPDNKTVVLFDAGWAVWEEHGRCNNNNETPYDVIEEVNEMKIEVGKFYKNKAGHKRHIVWFNEQKDCPNNSYYLDSEGYRYYTYEIDKHLVEEWKEPKSGVGYVNIYPDKKLGAYFGNIKDIKSDAKQAAICSGQFLLACVRVEWKEGQFDD